MPRVPIAPHSERTQINVMLTPDQAAKIRIIAKRQAMTISEVVRRWIDRSKA